MELHKIRNTAFDEYNEKTALYALEQNLNIALEVECARLDADSSRMHDYDQITIIVNGIVHGFYLGGPQVDGLYDFINHVCDENGYDHPGDVCQPPYTKEHLIAQMNFAFQSTLSGAMTRKNVTTGNITPEQQSHLDKLIAELVDLQFILIEQNMKSEI